MVGAAWLMPSHNRASGNGMLASIAAIAIVFIIAYAVLFPAIQNQSCAQDFVVTGPATELAAEIENYPIINGTDCSSVLELMSNENQILADMNSVLGTNFDQANINSACTYSIQIAPMLGTYNGVILSARTVNPNNATSITAFYEKLFLLAADIFIVNSAIDEIAYKTAFESTGELNDSLKLGELTELCGDACYSEVLSQIHWFIRDNFSNMLADFLGWAENKLEPSSCSS